MRRSLACLLLLSFSMPAGGAIVADHGAVAEWASIPAASFAEVRATCRIFYGHTSHGSQLVTGLGMLAGEDPVLYQLPAIAEYGSDLGHNGDTSWVAPTRSYLNQHPECNVVLWSWCGGCSDNTEAGIAAYLAAMSQLELDYPAVRFVYMTGHLDGTGPSGNLYRRNDQIRAYCQAEDKLLFDFADIESWDPAGVYYPDESDACLWCADWCDANPCPDCDGCAHSHCFNCYLKGKGLWWLLARISGWQTSSVPPAELPAPPRLSRNHPNPFNPGTALSVTLETPGWALLEVLDLAGRRLALLHDGELAAGEQRFQWDGLDAGGRALPSGLYLCRLRVAGREESLKMTLLK
jgi:hypothetical protein